MEDYEVYGHEEGEKQDVEGVCRRLKMAWKLIPEQTLAEVLEITLPSSITELTDIEIMEALDEFIHQNQ